MPKKNKDNFARSLAMKQNIAIPKLQETTGELETKIEELEATIEEYETRFENIESILSEYEQHKHEYTDTTINAAGEVTETTKETSARITNE